VLFGEEEAGQEGRKARERQRQEKPRKFKMKRAPLSITADQKTTRKVKFKRTAGRSRRSSVAS
jgi:hypothetical protein